MSYIWTDGTHMDLEFLNTLWYPGQPDNNVEETVLMWGEQTSSLNGVTTVRSGLQLAHMRNFPFLYVCKFKC